MPDAEADGYPPMYPDYSFTAIPCNIAPLNFCCPGASYVRADINAPECSLVVTGKNTVSIPVSRWKELLTLCKGKSLNITVSVWDEAHPDGLRYKPFDVYISDYEIDEWIVYRLIEPGYENWYAMGIYQRQLSSFTEQEIVSNQADRTKCLNCHSFAAYSPDRFLFHIRGENGCTALFRDGKPERLELNNLPPKKNGAYPAWRPDGRYVAFSSNTTRQSFLSEGHKPLEVYDLRSDLIVYDVETKQVIADERFNTDERWETFPAWSPDGRWLYYCVAAAQEGVPETSDKVHYSLCRVAFDNGAFGSVIDTVYDAERQGGSISFPRVSPDGKYIVCTFSADGTFPLWHDEADLLMFNLDDNNAPIDVSALNSPLADSYHAWSSNGRWLLFSSRRDDGRYTRLYIAMMGDDGRFAKPFLLPQRKPEHNTLRLKSYNVPEFVASEITIPQTLLDEFFK